MNKKNNKLTELVKQVEDLHRKMQRDGQVALKAAFADFFDAHPEATAIVWTQYTPHFNDGDACTFGVNDFELKVDTNKIAEDVKKLVIDQSNSEYGYGDGCAAGAVAMIEDTASNRKTMKEPWYKDKYEGIVLRKLTPEEKSLIEDFNELTDSCHAIPEILEMILGDHVMVTATKQGFHTDEQDHD